LKKPAKAAEADLLGDGSVTGIWKRSTLGRAEARNKDLLQGGGLLGGEGVCDRHHSRSRAGWGPDQIEDEPGGFAVRNPR
jgi:hypothetical protein